MVEMISSFVAGTLWLAIFTGLLIAMLFAVVFIVVATVIQLDVVGWHKHLINTGKMR